MECPMQSRNSPAEAVTVWKDRSGHEREATATGSPTFVVDGLNGKPAVRLNGTSDFLRTTEGEKTFMMLIRL